MCRNTVPCSALRLTLTKTRTEIALTDAILRLAARLSVTALLTKLIEAKTAKSVMFPHYETMLAHQ